MVVPTEIRTRIATLHLFYSKIEADLRRMDDSHKSGSSQKLITIEEKNASTDEAELKENCETRKNPTMLECDTSNVEMMMDQLTVLSERATLCGNCATLCQPKVSSNLSENPYQCQSESESDSSSLSTSLDRKSRQLQKRDGSDNLSLSVSNKKYPFFHVRRYLKVKDESRRAPSRAEAKNVPLKQRCNWICKILQANNFDKECHYNPPFSWLDYYQISAKQYRENVPDFRDDKFKRKKIVKLPLAQSSSESESEEESSDEDYESATDETEPSRKDVLKEALPGPSPAPKLVFSQSFKKQKKDFNQEKARMDVICEEMVKMREEMSRLYFVVKDEQLKRTITEQQLEQKMQEEMNVFKRLLSSKLLSNAFASEVSATTSKLPTFQLPTVELSNTTPDRNPTSSTEQQERSRPISVTNLPVRTQTFYFC